MKNYDKLRTVVTVRTIPNLRFSDFPGAPNHQEFSNPPFSNCTSIKKKKKPHVTERLKIWMLNSKRGM